ncbi:MAG: baseplate J/gp47 family protein [Anaerolineaceae bacterium]|nr:baseplate J/gp47 family protein [Anaerolineaceae bacterium]
MEIILILRAAEEIGTQLSVVTDDPVIRRQMQDLGVSTFGSIPEAQKRPWRKPKFINRSILKMEKVRQPLNLEYLENSKKALKEIPSTIRWILFVTSILSFLLIIFIFIPSATVTIAPVQNDQDINMDFRSDLSIMQSTITGAIPASVVEIELESQLEGESTGIIRIPEKNANGEVTFRNLSDREITIPSGTIVRTTNEPFVRFQTTKEVNLDPGIESTINVSVICLQGGIIGNIPSGAINAIESDLGGNVTVINDKAMTGGVDIKTFSPTEGDYSRLKNELIKKMYDDVINEIQNSYPQALLIPKDSIVVKLIISEERLPEVGNPAERHVLKLKVIYSAWIILKEDVDKSIELALNANLSSQFLPVVDSINYQLNENSIEYSNNKVKWNASASRKIISKIDQQEIIKKIIGKSKSQASAIIMDEIPLQKEPVFEIFPKFMNFLPFLPYQITVVIDG